MQTATVTMGFIVRDELGIVQDSLPDAVVGQPYNVLCTAEGGVTPYAWSAADPQFPLPPGLTISATGLISGTPTAASPLDNQGNPVPFNAKITVTDSTN